ncbi:alpha-L-iduronidase-like [Oppia nitens]|uniref:alpha-L-iduronidase-like n=1 Tax=Oppia nitens TaxID=1686743 RepID=UPI0023DBE54A|nr:alpha-L-iduronidase-like [Oppia nitens]
MSKFYQKENTGFCPPDPHSDAFTYMLSSDMHHNLALIGSVPHNGIKQIRIHYLLKLIQVDVFNGQFEYNFTYLDQLITLLRNYNLKPGFELMGNPSNIYNDFENKTQIIQWKEMVQQMIRRYIKKFGLNYIKQWNFESWNEPSIEFKHYFSDNIKVTPKGFLNYYDSCSLAIKEIDNNLVFGGPGDHWPKDIKNGSFVIDLINHFINGSNFLSGKKSDIKLDYLSLHEKGSKGQSSYTDYLEDKALNDISYYFNTLKNIPFVNNEGDPEVGWNRNRTWRADNRYAATIVQSVARHIYGYNYTNKLSQFAFDNAFLSYYPYQFTQRTLLARFQINNTKPHFTQFIKKPALSVMGLLSKLGDHLLHFKSNVKSNSTFNIISSAYFGTKNVSLLEFG